MQCGCRRAMRHVAPAQVRPPAVTTATRFPVQAQDGGYPLPMGGFPMISLVRAGIVAALVMLASFSSAAIAAEKSFQRDDLKEAAARFEGEIRTQAGQVG